MSMKRFDFEDVFGETENVTSEKRLLEEEKLGKIFEEIDFNLYADAFFDADKLLQKIEAELTRDLWVYNARFYLQKLMVELRVSNEGQLAEKCGEVVVNINFKKAKISAEKANDSEMLARLGRIESLFAQRKTREAEIAEEQRLAEERRLAEIRRKEIEADFEISDGVLIKYRGNKTEVVIPDCVTVIGEKAFYECRDIKSITIPYGVTAINYEAFSRCTGLPSISIPDSVTSIGGSAFNYCINLTSMTIPASVTSIGKHAFADCRSFTFINVDENNEHYRSIDGNLYSKDGKTLINYARAKTNTMFNIPRGVKHIGEFALFDCKSLISITLPESVEIIDAWAFCACKSLRLINIPSSVTSIGNDAFAECSALTSITLPEGVESIGQRAFTCCDSLMEITIPESVKSIGWSAFSRCMSLREVTIPDRLFKDNLYIPDTCKIIRT